MCTLEKMLFKLVSLNTLLFKYGASSHPVLPTEQLGFIYYSGLLKSSYI